jgi:glycerol uptake facilitator-like aquaporin
MFAEVSGGVFNPAIILSQITWQNLTYYFELGADQSYWTPEYATCYCLAPFIGAFMAGNAFGY